MLLDPTPIPDLQGRPSWIRQSLAWCVHFYTALGLICAAAIAVCIVEGTPAAFHRAFLLMFLATVIDATDGTLARAIHIKETLPGFDGRRLDDIIDFLTYTFLPLLLVWRAEILPQGYEGWLLVPLLASIYGFCQVSIKTEDGYFLGFPSYWNLVALYLYLLNTHVASVPLGLSLGTLLGLALLTFVPTRYLYPSQKGRLNRFTTVFGAAWALLLLALFVRLAKEPADEVTQGLIVGSLVFPLYYLGASWWVSWQLGHGRRKGPVS